MSGVKPSPKRKWIKKSIAQTAGKQPDGAGLARILKKSKAASRYSQVVVTKKVT